MNRHSTRSAGKQEVRAPQAQPHHRSARPLPRPAGVAAALFALHRTHGNRFVQRLLAGATHGDAEASAAVTESIERTRGGGHALPPGLRLRMESAFGADFAGVRLHTDAHADALNRALSAAAFTTGRDIYFRQGQYDPEGASGRRLLAHELTHVAQQAGSTHDGGLVVGAPDDMYEREADQMADAVMQTPEHESPRPRPLSGGVDNHALQRMCAECEATQEPPARVEMEEEEPTPAGIPPGLGGGSCGAGVGPQVEDALEAGVAGGRVAPVSGGARPRIQRQPLTKRGEIGCPVPELQEALNATGEALVVDGNFGPLTQAAVRRFQTAHHPPLVVDGDVGANTWPVLHAAAPGDHGLPAGETTTTHGWAGGGVHRWRQRLTPFATSFGSTTAGRCRVREADGGGGADTCHFAGSAFAPFTAITGGTWDVDGTNHWGDDFVGWFAPAVNYYRAQGRAPCFASFTQSMRVVRPAGDVEYRRNVLRSDIGVADVTSTRDGQAANRAFP